MASSSSSWVVPGALILLLLQDACYTSSSSATKLSKTRRPFAEPYFDAAETSSNVTVLTGQTVFMQCTVRNINNKSVSWLRHMFPIPHVLAVNAMTSTAYPRLASLRRNDTFVLRLADASTADSGVYECQVAGDGDTDLYRLIYVNVIDPTTEILSASDVYVDRGSTLNLSCVIAAGPKPPDFVMWTHEGKMVLYDSSDPMGTDSHGRFVSVLSMSQVSLSQAGEYACQPHAAPPASVHVHVINSTVLAVEDDNEADQEAVMSHVGRRRMSMLVLGITTLLNRQIVY